MSTSTWRSARSTASPARTSCSTPFSCYENYPVDTAALSGINGLAITEFTNREYNHYPLTVQAQPGPELGLRVEFDTDVFDAASIEALIERLERVVVAMTADPTRRLSSVDVLDEGEHARLDELGNRAVLTQPATRRCRFRCCSPRRWPAPRRRWR